MEGQATDQVIRIIIDGAEMILRASGKGVERSLAFFAALQTASKEKKQKVIDDLNSGGIGIIEMKPEHFATFQKEAKKWGISEVFVRDRTRDNGNILFEYCLRERARVNAILRLKEIPHENLTTEFTTGISGKKPGEVENTKQQSAGAYGERNNGDAILDEMMKEKDPNINFHQSEDGKESPLPTSSDKSTSQGERSNINPKSLGDNREDLDASLEATKAESNEKAAKTTAKTVQRPAERVHE